MGTDERVSDDGLSRLETVTTHTGSQCRRYLPAEHKSVVFKGSQWRPAACRLCCTGIHASLPRMPLALTAQEEPQSTRVSGPEGPAEACCGLNVQVAVPTKPRPARTRSGLPPHGRGSRSLRLACRLHNVKNGAIKVLDIAVKWALNVIAAIQGRRRQRARPQLQARARNPEDGGSVTVIEVASSWL